MSITNNKRLLEVSNAYIKDGILVKCRWNNKWNFTSNYDIDFLIEKGDVVVENNGVIDFYNLSPRILKLISLEK